MKFILHIDMNAFFASVEELQNPRYMNKPIAVSGKTKRSVIASANYVARAKGIKAAMPVYQALNLCKDLIIVVPHFHLYQEYSEKFLHLIEEKFSNKIEHFSIDECYVDISDLATNVSQSMDVAKKIQKTIYDYSKLKCSIGISNNKFLAKMASDFKKPMGISTCFTNEVSKKLWPLDIDEMLWIGKSTAELLRRHGIKTIGDMANKKNNQLVQKLLDKNWFVHVQHANGIGTDELDFSQNLPKSISAAETFLNDSDDFDEISKHLKELTSDVVGRLRKYHLKTKTITIYVKYPNFTQQNKSLSIPTMTDDFETIWLTSINIFQRYFINKLIRLIGIKLDHFATPEINLFSSELWEDAKEVINKNDVEKNIIKIVNDKFKRKIIDIANNKLK